MSAEAIKPSSSFLKFVPLLTPAVEEKGYSRDYQLLGTRMAAAGVVAIASFVGSQIALYSHLTVPLAFAASLPIAALIATIFVVTMIFDTIFADRAIDAKAVDDYMKNNPPSYGLGHYLSSNLKAVKLLIEKKGDINKLFGGKSLLTYGGLDFEVFKLLIDNDINLLVKEANGKSFFHYFVESKDSKYVEYILDKQKVAPKNFTEEEQWDLWMNFGTVKTAELLKAAGFNIDAKETGMTPLIGLVVAANQISSCKELTFAERLSTLLKLGADRNITVTREGITGNALQLNKDPKLKEILEKSSP